MEGIIEVELRGVEPGQKVRSTPCRVTLSRGLLVYFLFSSVEVGSFLQFVPTAGGVRGFILFRAFNKLWRGKDLT